MSRKKDDEIVAYAENVSNRHLIIDNPESSQVRRREGTLPDSLRIAPGCKVGMTARQVSEWREKRGISIKSADSEARKHLKRMG